MRNKIVAGNWKMNTGYDEAMFLIEEIIGKISFNAEIPAKENLKIVLAPPYLYLKACVDLTNTFSNIHTSAQNCHSEDKGAYTGEISAAMIRSLGADYVIIGHSERRSYFHEDHAFLSAKVVAALKNSLIPIFCIGEILSERETGRHFEVIKNQLEESLFSLTAEDFRKLVIAYEPVWAIGTGLTATPAQAQEMHQFIRNTIATKYGHELANAISILYGGSCNAKNAKDLFSMPDVDGGLIGGASLKAEDFISIIESIL